MIGRVAALIGIFVMLAAPLGARRPSINERIKQQQLQVDSVDQKLQRKRAQLGTAKAREHDLQQQLAQTDHAIAGVNSRLDDLSMQARKNQRQLSLNTAQLNAAQATLSRFNQAYRHRLVDIYEHGDTGYLEVLLRAKSFSDFVERWDDLRLLLASNQRAVELRQRAKTRVEQMQHRLELARMSIDTVAQQEGRAKSQLDALATERQQLVEVADVQRRHIATEVTQLEEVSAAQAAALQSLVIEREREYEAYLAAQAAARRAAAAEAARRRAAAIAANQPAPPPPPAAAGEDNTLALSWPAAGPITSPFGWRMHPIYHRLILHEGLDIGASMGATILAAASGRVILAGWVSGYGNYIGIAHGNGVETGYGHCSGIFVTVGQDVQRGQAIGAVGSTGNSTGPHLHFEVRVNGSPVDPTGRLR